MKKLVFMLEEPSIKEVLLNIIPRILPEDIHPIYISHEGKSNLRKSIPQKLLTWNDPDVRFMIVQDQDSNDCMKLKKDIVELVKNNNHSSDDTLIRIVCAELESWFLGDFQAIEKAFNIDLKNRKNKSIYRNPDIISNAKQELKKLVPQYQQISGAQSISKFMNIAENKSHSFQVFISGVKKLYT